MKAQYKNVTVLAPARLHMGFIDLSRALGRDFGSIGIGLKEINTQVSISQAEILQVSGPVAERAKQLTQQLCQVMQVSDNLRIELISAIPEHVGLGSGTQMCLAIGMGLSEFYGLGLTARDVARLTERGARSGIGIAVFEKGGLVVDGGRGPTTQTPPLLAHLPVPADWRFILVFDQRGQGLHGQQEINAFKQLPAFSRSDAEKLSYLLLMQALPAVAENDLTSFGAVISALQAAVGEHFAAVQGGIFTSPEVAAAMQMLEQLGAVAIGQTSWGPTGFCAVKAVAAQAMLQQAEQAFAGTHLVFMLVTASNQGAEITHS
ncbi:GHMP kinase [Methylomonas paludis]|uniref:GHMP kinase n=1 Tax=Methylomonas paludis TaxID=1173101 RepID=A0A975MLA3_9GAMM|nr:beta-ribofuranosylaminobenzene 5'-phosphate synthase family protein [Methylomonas paludis]QWF69907.1 GHMP kinase [Methylomonas paludis]